MKRLSAYPACTGNSSNSWTNLPVIRQAPRLSSNGHSLTPSQQCRSPAHKCSVLRPSSPRSRRRPSRRRASWPSRHRPRCRTAPLFVLVHIAPSAPPQPPALVSPTALSSARRRDPQAAASRGQSKARPRESDGTAPVRQFRRPRPQHRAIPALARERCRPTPSRSLAETGQR